MKDHIKKQVEHISSVKYTDFENILIDEFGSKFAEYRKNYYQSINYNINKVVPDFPITVNLELVNRCNLKCIMCYTINHKDSKATFQLADIDKLTKECKEHQLPAMIVGLGSEALIYKNIREAIQKITEAGVMDLFLGTNGVLLKEDLSYFLVKNRIARVEISLDAATPETYLKIRGKDELLKVEENINKLLAVRNKLNSKLPIVRLCFCVQEQNVHEQEAFVEKWKDKVDYLDFQEMVDFSGVSNMRKVNIDEFLGEDAHLKELKDAYCAYPFNSLSVWSNGDVTPCCSFYGKALVVGNVRDMPLKEIWLGEKMQTIRKQIISGKLNDVCYACLTHRDTKNFKNIKEQKNSENTENSEQVFKVEIV